MKKLFTTIIMIAIMLATLSINPNLTFAADETSQEPTVKTSVYGENKAIKVELTNINLDDTHEYQYGVSLAKATQPTNWYALTEAEENKAILVITPKRDDMLTVLRTTENACVFLKDVTDNDKIIIDGIKVSLKMDYSEAINISLYEGWNGRCMDITSLYGSSTYGDCYTAVEKIDDINIIKKYLESKDANSSTIEAVKDLIKTDPTTINNWKKNDYNNINGDTKYEGLYLLWGHISYKEGRSIYGYILYDTFPDGYKLAEQNNDTNQSTDTGNNNGATNNDNTNKGTTTPETKNPETGSGTTTPGQTDTNSGNGQTVTPKTDPEDDNTTASTGKLPYTGVGIGIIAFIAVVFAIGTVAYCKYFRLKDI